MTIAVGLAAMVLLAVTGAAVVYRRRGWPDELQLGLNIPDRLPMIMGAAAAVLALICLALAVVNAHRWLADRAAGRLSNEPSLREYLLPALAWPPPAPPAEQIPPLSVDVVVPRELDRQKVDLQPVVPDGNVIGEHPLHIAYLRLFENQPRTRTFLQGAWREFGYVTMLRSAASLSPGEFRSARQQGAVDALFANSTGRLGDELDHVDRRPWPPGRLTLRGLGRQPVHVRDPYGSYPVHGVLCHGAFWMTAVDALLARSDVVVVDLSGMAPDHLGSIAELRRVLDRFPIQRVMFLADERSDTEFLAEQLRAAWQHLAAGSPNAGSEAQRAVIAVTDHMAWHDEPSGKRPAHVRLVARRGQNRKVAALAQARAA